MQPETAQLQELRRLWDQHSHAPFPAADTSDPRLQELALYESWVGGVVEAALGRGGRLTRVHALMLEVREREGNQSLWGTAAELGEPVRSYVARLLAIQEVLTTLPVD
ncbi:MAG: hypothetical protein J2P28_26980 [Actinobacteria bacterium]|nr:hypothetical protein [Actinomycetota bacterium]